MKPDTQERPDFEKAAEEVAKNSPLPVSRADFESQIENAAMFGYDLSRKRIEELEAELYSIRNKFVDMMPSGQTNAWDWVTFSKSFLTWYDKQIYKLIAKK